MQKCNFFFQNIKYLKKEEEKKHLQSKMSVLTTKVMAMNRVSLSGSA